MTSVVSCPSCGETYVSTAEVCADCGVPLATQGEGPAAVHLDPTDDEVGYDLDDWEPEQRGELVTALIARGIAHRWDDGELVVRERDADWVEPMIDEVDNPGAVIDLVEAEAEAAEIDAPFGVPPETWAEIKRRASLLTAMLDDGGEEVDIRLAARDLRDLLHPLV
jgi:hypothetical protein